MEVPHARSGQGAYPRFQPEKVNQMALANREFPSLTTERLRLRAPHVDDAAAYGAVLSIPEVTHYSDIPDAPTMAVIERMMRFMSKLYESRKGCAWIIEDAASSRLVGAIRFNHFDRRWRVGEIGYESHPDFWGRGLMTEALRAVIGHGHQMFRLNRIEAWTLPGNSASDRVLEKGGFRYEGTLRQKARFKGRYHDFRMFGRVAADPMIGNS
jgi:[ribosomal protein S5]-alanine N-acetyltransferase